MNIFKFVKKHHRHYNERRFITSRKLGKAYDTPQTALSVYPHLALSRWGYMIPWNFMVSLHISPIGLYSKICAAQDSEAKLFELRLDRLPQDRWRRCNFDKATNSTGLTNVCWQDIKLPQTLQREAFYHAQKALKSFSAPPSLSSLTGETRGADGNSPFPFPSTPSAPRSSCLRRSGLDLPPQKNWFEAIFKVHLSGPASPFACTGPFHFCVILSHLQGLQYHTGPSFHLHEPPEGPFPLVVCAGGATVHGLGICWHLRMPRRNVISPIHSCVSVCLSVMLWRLTALTCNVHFWYAGTPPGCIGQSGHGKGQRG